MNDAGDRIASSLRLLRAAWPDMLPQGPTTAVGGHTTGSKEPPPPAPIAVLSLRREVCEILADWCRVVLDDQLDINGGQMQAHIDGTDGPGMAGWLLTWADFLGAHPAGADAVAELGRLSRQCDAVAEQRRVRRFPVGPCIEHSTTDSGERVRCAGTLVAVLSSDDDLLPAVLRCDANPVHVYEAHEWMMLGRRLEQDAS